MEIAESAAVVVSDESGTGDARRRAAEVARSVGMDATAAGKVAIVATEIATNLVKHAHGGTLVLSALRQGAARGVALLGLDRGPGIPNLAACLRDGHSTAGSPGTGLGAIRRLSTFFDVYSGTGGTAVLSFVGTGRTAGCDGLAVGGVCVPKPGEDECGDAWAVVQERGRCMLLVVDGLGHGPEAARAAREAIVAFRRLAAGPPAEVLARLHDALRATRGAAAAIAEIDRERRIVRVAGVGNIAGTVVADGQERHLVSLHGTLGHDVRKTQEFSYPWPEQALLVLHSDGLTSRWDLEGYPGLAQRDPMLVAGVLYRDAVRGRDDATVVVIREPT